jgi:hypothetical protein
LSLLQHENSFLAQRDWRDLPWTAGDDKKAQFDGLLDIFFDMSKLAIQREELKRTVNPRHVLSKAFATLSKGQDTALALNQWFDEFRRTVPGGLYYAKLSSSNNSANDTSTGRLFPVAFHFPASIVAQNLVYYWAAQIFVQSHLCLIHNMVSRSIDALELMDRSRLPCLCDSTGGRLLCLQHFTADLLPGFESRDDWPHTPACNICQSVEYFLSDPAPGPGPITIMPALIFAKGMWKHAPPGSKAREIAWIDDILRGIARSGSGIAIALAQTI